METSNGMGKTKIIGAVVLLVVVVGLIWFLAKGSTKQQVSRLDVTDTVKGFYDNWLKATQDKAAEPNRATLAKSPILSKKLKGQIASALKQSDATLDPVLCQKAVPEKISTRTVFENATQAQILVTSGDKKVTEQAIVTLNKLNEGWYIDDIKCSLGEFAPEREFSFEGEGYLLKGSIPPPYNAKDWHLVFEEDGKAGNVVPLLFDSASQCTKLDGSKSACKPDEFTEATKASIRGQMTERGVYVNQLGFVK